MFFFAKCTRLACLLSFASLFIWYGVKLFSVSNCSRCQIVRSVKLSVFTHGVKLSLCQIVRCQIVHGLSKNALFTVRLTLRVDTLQPPVYGQLFVRKKFKGSIRPRIMIIYNIKLILTTKKFTMIC